MEQSEVDRLAMVVGEYAWIIEKNSDKIRGLPGYQRHYDVALEQFNVLNLMHPPRGDEQKRKDYFAFCKELCDDNPSTPQACIFSAMMAGAAVQVIIDQDMQDITDEQHGRISRISNDYVMAKAIESKGFQVPQNLDDPADLDRTGAGKTESGANLVGKTIQYRDKAGNVRECTVHEYGVSVRKGGWFVVEHADDGEEVMIWQIEMEDIVLQV